MGKLQEFSIHLEQPNGVLYAGQRLLGCVNLSLSEPMKCRNLRLILTGRAKTKWSKTKGSGDDRRRVTYRGHESYVDDVIVLFRCPEGGDTTKIPEGHHQFPFEFVLPPNCPSSFQGEYGWIRYYLTAVIDKPWKFDHEIEEFFTVIGQHDLNADPMAVGPIEEFKEKSLGLFGSGKLTCLATMPYCGLVSGQGLNLSVRIETTSKKGVTPVRVYLKQQTQFIADSGFLSNHEKFVKDIILSVSNDTFIPGNTPTTLDFTIVQIPPVPPMLINCSIINISYYVHVEVVPGGMHTDLDLKFPIIIGTIPLKLAFQQVMPSAPRQPEPAVIPGLYPAAPFSTARLDAALGGGDPYANASAPGGQRMVGQNSGIPTYESMYPDLPPPSYESCMVGQRSVEDGDEEEDYNGGGRNQTDADDDEEERKKGGTSNPSFLPKYPTYTFKS